MITEVKNVEFNIIDTSDPFEQFRDDIERFWAEYCSKHPEAYSEKILNLFGSEETAHGIRLIIGWINYYEAFYSKIAGNIQTRNLFSGAYIITSDGYYCVAVDWNSEINLIGGVASAEDFENGKYIPEKCLVRECKEEMGIDITDDHFSYELKYLKITSGDENYFPTGLIYEVKTDYTKSEIEELFMTNAHDNELQAIKFLRPDDSEVLAGSRRKYIFELFDMMRK